MTNPPVTHVTETITPGKAREYLQNNKRNRPLKEWRVKQLMADMIGGRWHENGEAGITFDWNSDIAGGQHTLEAISRSGISIRCRVTRGVDPDARATMNDSFKQRFSDDLHIAGIPAAGFAEPLLRKILTWDRAAAADPRDTGGLTAWTNQRYSRSQLTDMWPEYAEGITRTLTEVREWRKMDWPGNIGVLHFIHWLLTTRYPQNPGLVREFIDRLCYGSQQPQDKILIRVAKDKLTTSHKAPEQVYWLCRAWNAWNKHEPLTHLKSPVGGIHDPYPRLVKTSGDQPA